MSGMDGRDDAYEREVGILAIYNLTIAPSKTRTKEEHGKCYTLSSFRTRPSSLRDASAFWYPCPAVSCRVERRLSDCGSVLRCIGVFMRVRELIGETAESRWETAQQSEREVRGREARGVHDVSASLPSGVYHDVGRATSRAGVLAVRGSS